MAIDIIRLRRPEEQDGEEVRAGDERNNKGEGQDPWLLQDLAGEHGILGPFHLIDDEGGKHDETNDERCEHVCARPGVLVPAPLDGGHEEQETEDGEEATDVVNAREGLPLRESGGVGARWREVEDGGEDEADEGPYAAEETDVAPRSVGRDQLAPEHGGAEW